MSISIHTNKKTGILEVTYSPEPVTPEDLAEQREILADAVVQSNVRKVLIDASSLPRFPSTFTALKHNESVAANDNLRETKFAVVCSSLGEDERSLETTGVNRGLRIKCFISRQKAVEWLNK